ncbi:MAG: hypothetical protein WC812_04620 [Candidatus Pacearchaeota archaeon]|jgi:hypothetical protein
MKKKAQVTIFVIIALVLIALILGGYFLFKKNNSGLNEESKVVFSYVQDCLDKSSEKVIWRIGKGGGFFYPSENSTNEGITYYYRYGNFLFPLKEDIEEEISKFVSIELLNCTNNFSNFKEYSISFSNPVSHTEILKDKINIYVEYPIKISKGQEISILKEFSVIKEVRLGLIYDTVEKMLIEGYKKNGICLSCNLEHSLDNDFEIDYLNSDSLTTILIIKDNYLYSNKPFEFIFANDYSKKI